MTDLAAVLATLKKERDKLNKAIDALSGLGKSGGVDFLRVAPSCQLQFSND